MSLELSRLIANVNPNKPLPAGSPYYVPLDVDPPIRGDLACIERLRRTIVGSAEPTCQLFTGFPGTGKTTELNRLAGLFQEAQAPGAAHVLVVDFEQYVERYQPISVGDVLRTLAYCFAREADRVEGELKAELHGERYLRRFFKGVREALPRSADLKGVEFEVFGVKLMTELRRNPSIRRQIEDGIRLRFQHFIDECKDEIGEALARIGRVLAGRADRVVVLADGLEKLDALDERDRPAVEQAVESLFVVHADLLRLPCHVVYTFPVWLRFRSAQLGASYSREPLTLPMPKIRDPNGAPYEPGVAKMLDLLRVRLIRPDAVFTGDPSAALRPIITNSGGFPRDMLRIVRGVLQDAERLPVGPDDVERAIEGLRRSYHDMVLGTHVEMLRSVAHTHAVPHQTEEQRRHFGELFTRFLILAYHNGAEWFDVHPLARDAPALRERFGEPLA